MTEQKCPHRIEITAECSQCEGEPDTSNILALTQQVKGLLLRLNDNRKELTIESAIVNEASYLVIDCLAAIGVDVENLLMAPYDAVALNTMRQNLPDSIRKVVRERDELKSKFEDLELCYRGCSVIRSDIELEVEKLTTELQKAREQIDKLTSKWIKPSERLPDADGQFSVIKNGSRRTLTWNSYHQVWDDDEGDDFYCEPLDVDYWRDEPFVDDPVVVADK